MDRAGLSDIPLRKWLSEYAGSGQHGRISLGEDKLRIAYGRDHELTQLELLCRFAGADPLDIADASDEAKQVTSTSAQGRIFRGKFPWTSIVEGLQAFVERAEGHVGDEVARQLQSEAEEAFGQSSPVGATEAQQLATRRIGQNIFRAMLLRYWRGRCPISGIDEPKLLRASHIKPWADSNGHERLSPFNGILLSANIDAAFDAGLISFSDEGIVLRSQSLSDDNFEALGIPLNAQLSLTPAHAEFLPWHRRTHGYDVGQ